MQILDTLTGLRRLPWEDESDPQYSANMRRLGRMRKGVMSMLVRDPTQRANLSDVIEAWNLLLQGAHNEAL